MGYFQPRLQPLSGPVLLTDDKASFKPQKPPNQRGIRPLRDARHERTLDPHLGRQALGQRLPIGDSYRLRLRTSGIGQPAGLSAFSRLAANCAQSAAFCSGASAPNLQLHYAQRPIGVLGGIKTAHDCRNSRGGLGQDVNNLTKSTEKPVLDPEAFQRLLAAAFILQSQNDPCPAEPIGGGHPRTFAIQRIVQERTPSLRKPSLQRSRLQRLAQFTNPGL